MKKSVAMGAAVVLAATTLLAAGNGPGPGPQGVDDPSDWKDIMVAHTPATGAVYPVRPSAVYTVPATFEAILNYGFAPGTLQPAAAVVPLQRYLVGAAAGYLTVAPDAPAAATTALATYRDLETKVVEAVAEGTGGLFRLDSELHGNFALDADPSNGFQLIWRNVQGAASSASSRGYVTFRYDAPSRTLKAAGRVVLRAGDFTRSPDQGFRAAGWAVRFEGTGFRLVADAAQATAVTFYRSPVNVDMPPDFNADQSPYQPNQAVPIQDFVRNSRADIEGDRSKVLQDLDSAYRPQVVVPGPNAGTQAAAEAMLATIQKTLSAEGARLRYAPELYLTFRKALLAATLQSDSIANGVLGQPLTPYVYFTNAADSRGVHHPFLCVASYSISDKPVRLFDVTRPPGDGNGGGYSDQNVTRNATLQLYLHKIPLRDYGLIGKLGDNPMAATLKSDGHGEGADSNYNLASIAGTGVAVDGGSIYPLFSNMLVSCQEKGEITSTGIHVGQGMGLHWHSDGHTANANDFQLYNLGDYANQPHPPVIGFALDGIAIYGTYEAAFARQEGIDVPLDEFGGHSHGVYGYHYHAHQVQSTSSAGNAYVNHVIFKGAWRGRIADIPDFWETRKPQPNISLAQRTVWAGKK